MLESMALVLHHSRATGTAKLVLLGIANHDGDGGAWPSLATLATYANCTVRGVQKCITELERLGEVKRELNAGGRLNTPYYERPNLYHVLVTCPVDCDRSKNHRRWLPAVDNPVNHSSPGEPQFTGGVNHSSPDPVNHSSPEPAFEPPPELLGSVREQLKDARARGRRRP